jgi:DNA-binding response OmpR family regulator
VVADCLGDWPGTEVDCAHDGIAAVETLKGSKFSLALIDIMLPGLSSSNLAQAAVNDDTPVLMLSSHPEMTTKNVDRVRSSLARLKERAGALQAAMQENRRLLGESMDQSARAEGRALG